MSKNGATNGPSVSWAMLTIIIAFAAGASLGAIWVGAQGQQIGINTKRLEAIEIHEQHTLDQENIINGRLAGLEASAGFSKQRESEARVDIERFKADFATIIELKEEVTRLVVEAKSLQEQISKMRTEVPDLRLSQSNWEHFKERDAALTERINELQKAFAGSFNIGDQVKSLQTQLDILRQNQLSHQTLPLSSPPPQTSFH